MSEIIHKDKEGTKFKFRKLTYFARNGMVMIIDDSDGSMNLESPMVMRGRAVAFAQESESMRQHGGHLDSERRELLKAARDLMMVIQEAEKQGCPLDPRVAEQMMQEKRKVAVSMARNHELKPRTSPGGIILPG